MQTDGQLENLERMTHDIEFAQIEVQVVNGLKQGNEALKKVNEALNLEDVEKLLEETREGAEKQNELSELLSGRLTAEDEDAVEAELDQIIADTLPEVPHEEVPTLPDVPEKGGIRKCLRLFSQVVFSSSEGEAEARACSLGSIELEMVASLKQGNNGINMCILLVNVNMYPIAFGITILYCMNMRFAFHSRCCLTASSGNSGSLCGF